MTFKVNNVMSPVPPAFTPDELSLIIGTCVPEAVAVLDPVDGKILAGNGKLEETLGVLLGEDGAEILYFDDFLHPEDRGLFKSWRAEDPTGNSVAIELRLLAKDGREALTEAHLSHFRWRREEFLLAYFRPTTDDTAVQELKEKISEQKRKTLEAVKSSLLIYQFTEKIKRTPVLTTNLLSTDNETQLFERAARILTSEGLNYKDVTFLLVEGEFLEVRHSTRPFTRTQFPLSEDNKYTRFVQGSRDGKTLEREMLVPLKSRGDLLGVIEVTLHPRERIFFDELNLVSEWQRDALFTIGDMIALLLDNLRLYREVKRQSVTDTLTGVYNRHYFINRLSTEINRCARGGHPISLIFIDVDEFKAINDRFGHLQGDSILRELGEIFRTNIREYDCVCRYGGDEFVILLPEITGEQAQNTAQKLLGKVSERQFSRLDRPQASIQVSISLGVSELDRDLDEDLFLKTADEALYRAKELGRNQMVFNKA